MGKSVCGHKLTYISGGEVLGAVGAGQLKLGEMTYTPPHTPHLRSGCGPNLP